jgi:hypothetical protein
VFLEEEKPIPHTEEEAAPDPWSRLKSFKDFQEAMLQYLKGNLDRTPFVVTKVDKETVGVLKKLRSINRAGLVTVESQPGTCVGDKNEYEHQRGYISGFLLRCRSKKFLDNIVRGGQAVAVVTSWRNRRDNPVTYPVGKWDFLDETEFRPGGFLNVTVDKLPDNHPRYYTNTPLCSGPEDIELMEEVNPTFAEYLAHDAIFVTVVLKKRCKQSLEDVVLNALKMF